MQAEPRRDEDGAALLTVLLLVSVLSVVTAIALDRLTLASRMTRNIVTADQGRAYLLAGEQMAALRIGDLVALRPDRTTLTGGWQGTPQLLAVPGGTVGALVRDGGNCFNLNSLVTTSKGPDGTETNVARPAAITQFAGLMRLIGIEPATADQVAVSAADWIDSDGLPGPGGAEDDYYSRFERPYLSAGNAMGDPSELRLVNGVTPQLYERIRPWICTLPTDALSPININTLLPDQAVLLAMLSPEKIGLDRARQVLAQRPADGYGSLVAFWQQPALATLALPDSVTAQVQQKSRWFVVRFSAELAGDKVEETVLYDAGAQPVRAVARYWGTDSD